MGSSNRPTRRRAMVSRCRTTVISSNKAAIHPPSNRPTNRHGNNRISRCHSNSHGQSLSRNNLRHKHSSLLRNNLRYSSLPQRFSHNQLRHSSLRPNRPPNL